jgi:hypothetical protein
MIKLSRRNQAQTGLPQSAHLFKCRVDRAGVSTWKLFVQRPNGAEVVAVVLRDSQMVKRLITGIQNTYRELATKNIYFP